MGKVSNCPSMFWQNRRRLITTCPPSFREPLTPVLVRTLQCRENLVLLYSWKYAMSAQGVENTLRVILRLQIFGFEQLAQDPEATEQFSKVALSLKSDSNEIIFSSPSSKMDTDFFRSCLIFVGSSPTWGDIFLLKSDVKWAFSYILIY